MKRIGIYAGTFNPVHAGHISFGLQAIEHAQLDAVYFLPERRPRAKTGVEHFGHRVAMLKKATRPHRKLKVLELEDVNFTVATSVPRLLRRFKHAQLVFLVGSDVAETMPHWQHVDRLLGLSELVIGVRSEHSLQAVREVVDNWRQQPLAVHIIDSYAPDVSSSKVRAGLHARRPVHGLLKSVERYSDKHWLYVSLMQQKSQ